MSVEERFARDGRVELVTVEDWTNETVGISDPTPKVVHVKVILQVGPESFPIAEDDLTEDTYRTQLVDLLRAAARELEDG